MNGVSTRKRKLGANEDASALPFKETLDYLNQFVIMTTTFLNQFANQCETKMNQMDRKMQRLEIVLNLLEVKLNSIEGLPQSSNNTNSFSQNNSSSLPNTSNIPPPPSSTDISGIPPPPPPPPPPMGSIPSIKAPTSDDSAAAPTAATSSNVMLAKNDPRLEKYFKMLYKIQVPRHNVEAKMKQELPGVDPSILDTPDAPTPLMAEEDPVGKEIESDGSFSSEEDD